MSRSLKNHFVLGTAVTAALVVAMPAQATIIFVPASSGQGTLVHGTGTETTAFDVIANLGSNGPNIVHFTGDTTQTLATSDLLRLQGGSGQADITGAEIVMGGSPNDVYDMLAGDIFLTGHAGIDYLEFALTSNLAGTLNFFLTDGLTNTVTAFNNIAIGNGDTHYAFDTTGLSSITNLHFSVNAPPGGITLLKQVRLDESVSSPVPEPAAWMLMLLGFAGIGFAMRKQRHTTTARVRFV